MGIRNIWSLNIDELLVADELKVKFSKSANEVFFPLNAQMKNIDLVLLQTKTGKTKTIQVKGSRTYVPRPSEVARFGEGTAAWFTIDTHSIVNTPNKVDFFVLSCIVLQTGK